MEATAQSPSLLEMQKIVEPSQGIEPTPFLGHGDLWRRSRFDIFAKDSNVFLNTFTFPFFEAMGAF
jgi:hypothetical protein